MRRNRNDAVLHSPPQSITIERPAPPLPALVIGIDKYLSNGIRNLRGADQIKNLRNKEATRVTVETEINNLGNNTAIKKGDPILIFFAGHGTETNAPSGWPTGSANGKMQLLVPHDFILGGSGDSEQGQGVLDVRLSHLLANMAAKKSDNITVILDCCHSGSGTRTDDPAVSPDARESVVAKGFEKTGLLSHVLLSACQAEQTAMEKHGRGVFTSALLSLLREKGVDKLTYKNVITNLPNLHAQDPQCEGVHQSRCLFNSKVASPQRESCLIRASSDTSGQYILEAGEDHGITRKAQFVGFADRRMTSALGTVVDKNTNAFTATCKFSSRGNGTPFLLAAPGYALQTRVANKMQAGKRGFRLVESRDDELDLVVAADVKIDDEDAIHRILQSSSDFYWHLHRSNERNPLTGKVTLECMKLKGTGEYTDELLEVLMPDPNGHNLNVGGVIMVDVDEDAIYGFQVTNTTSVPLYVSMFYFDASDLSISSYYQPGRAKKDTDVSLPPGDSLTIERDGSAHRAKTAKSRPSKRRAKDFEEETEEERNTRLAKERKKAWKEEVKQMVPWEYNSSFVMPQGMETITKGKAKETYKLNDRDLESLPYEQQMSVSGYTRKLYSLRDVKDICRRKNGPEIVDEAENPIVEYLTKSHDETDYAETPASYEPPTFECTKPSLPNDFAMRPGSRLITELEAMNLFLLRRYELEGLERKSINTGSALDSSEGLDYNEVQQRAMDCHGGFDGHNRKILDLSNEAVSKNYWDWGTYPEDLMIEFALSPIALKKSSKTSEPDDKAFLEVWWPPYDPIGDKFMRKVCAPGHCDGC
ncbi:uncharacterized protein ARMOST_09792 [Armillaria ostoyae]|uniref:Peptidase C14 caspase domain-containing protein n=1 Tax=Armillaria ostoyae TaxID=47428 RepID=A0A284RCJ4_ARMOS|nr:uncharacterized protein ARMOST_09792 [Armillaria ostoyae]